MRIQTQFYPSLTRFIDPSLTPFTTLHYFITFHLYATKLSPCVSFPQLPECGEGDPGALWLIKGPPKNGEVCQSGAPPGAVLPHNDAPAPGTPGGPGGGGG